MEFLSRLEKVKEHLGWWQEHHGDTFNFVVNEFATENEETGECKVYISKKEVWEILNYLATAGYLEIIDPTGPQIKILPKKEPTIRLKSLELMAKDIGELDTGPRLVDLLIDCKVDRRLIVYPNTKWRMIYAVLTELSLSRKKEDEETLFKIIVEATHPLMHEGDEKTAKLCEDKFNNILKYDSYILKNFKLNKIDKKTELDNKYEDDEDVFNYDGGISSPYENTDLELYIMKMILLEHKRRDDAGFSAKEFSFKNNTLKEICRVIERLMEDKILYLSANTRPERIEDEGGIEGEDGFINWKTVEKFEDDTQRMDIEKRRVLFDVEVTDEVKLKGRIDIAIEEFMNDKIYNNLGYMMSKTEIDGIILRIKKERDNTLKSALEKIYEQLNASLPYYKQRSIIIDEISKSNNEEISMSLNNYNNGQVDLFKTLLALEKENLLRITELKSNPTYDLNGNFIGKWHEPDNPVAKINILKIQENKQEPLRVEIIGMPDVKIKDFEEKVVLSKPKNKRIQLRKFPADLKWENISIQFLNGQEVIVNAKDETHQTTYEAMGFQDQRTKSPNTQWQFLKGLSETGGGISWESPRVTLQGKKHKQLLAESLKAYFQIQDDPFYPYKDEKSYRIKITLIPEVKSTIGTNEQEIYKDNDDFGIEEYFKEQSPEIYEK